MSSPNPWEALGLPPTWVPTPTVAQLGRIDGIAAGEPVHEHVLIIDSASGRQGFALRDEQVRALADALLAQVSGIDIVRSMPAHETNGGHP